MPKVTVIMPSLNVGKYIGSCMESVLAQTMQDMEILAIDAGSTDGTLEILQEFAKKDKRVKIVHSDKRSYGYQMNLGIELATGEYVGVVETDDLIEPDMFQILYEKAVLVQADYAKGSAAFFVELAGKAQMQVPVPPVFDDVDMYGQLVTPKDMPDLFYKDYYLWTGIYRKEFIKQVTLNETPGAAYQDAGFLFQVYTKAERALYLTDVFYLYRQDNTGASLYDKRSFGFLVKEYDYMKKFLPGLSREWQEAYYIRMSYHCQKRFVVMGASGEFWSAALPEMEELQGHLRTALQQGILQITSLNTGRQEQLNLFIENPRAIYEIYAAHYKPMVDNIREMYNVIGDRQVIIFGSGNWGRFLHVLVEHKKEGIVNCFCDNNKVQWGSFVQGIPVLSPEQASAQYPTAVYLIAGRRYETEMRTQLGELGIEETRIHTYTAGITDFLLFCL